MAPVDPKDLVNDVSMRAHELDTDDAPSLISQSAEPLPPLPPIRQDTEIQAIHQSWATLHSMTRSSVQVGGTGPFVGQVRARLRTWVRAAAARLAGLDDERALIGEIIRAVDVLATRADELGGRLAKLDALIAEVVTVLGEDLVHLRAVLEGREEGSPRSEASRGNPTTSA